MTSFLLLDGTVLVMPMHYNEFMGYPGAEVEEEIPCSAPVALWSVNPKVLEATRYCGQDIVLLGL